MFASTAVTNLIRADCSIVAVATAEREIELRRDVHKWHRRSPANSPIFRSYGQVAEQREAPRRSQGRPARRRRSWAIEAFSCVYNSRRPASRRGEIAMTNATSCGEFAAVRVLRLEEIVRRQTERSLEGSR